MIPGIPFIPEPVTNLVGYKIESHNNFPDSVPVVKCIFTGICKYYVILDFSEVQDIE